MITKETKIIKVNPVGIPGFLKALPYWINWKPVFIDGKAKKLPTYGETVLRGKYWETAGRSFADALRTIPANGGLSLLLSLQTELACIDIDDCAPNSPRLNKILRLAPDAWCDLSPSGNGFHVWGFLPDKQSYLLPGRKTIGYHGKEYEWYGSGRGITVTGHPLRGNCLADLTNAVKYCESLRPKVTEAAGASQNIYSDSFASGTASLQNHTGSAKTYGVPQNTKAPAANNTLATNAPSVDFILQKAFNADPELQRMYYHGHSWQDKSREDFRFCQRMWFWLGGYGAQTIENVFERSALYRKTKGPHYVSLTVLNAGKRWNGNYYGKKFG